MGGRSPILGLPIGAAKPMLEIVRMNFGNRVNSISFSSGQQISSKLMGFSLWQLERKGLYTYTGELLNASIN